MMFLNLIDHLKILSAKQNLLITEYGKVFLKTEYKRVIKTKHKNAKKRKAAITTLRF